MTPITRELRKAKGCEYCTDKITSFYGGVKHAYCPYNVCKYHEMDDCKTYEEYFKKDIPMSPETQALLAVFRESEMPLRKAKYLPR